SMSAKLSSGSSFVVGKTCAIIISFLIAGFPGLSNWELIVASRSHRMRCLETQTFNEYCNRHSLNNQKKKNYELEKSNLNNCDNYFHFPVTFGSSRGSRAAGLLARRLGKRTNHSTWAK